MALLEYHWCWVIEQNWRADVSPSRLRGDSYRLLLLPSHRCIYSSSVQFASFSRLDGLVCRIWIILDELRHSPSIRHSNPLRSSPIITPIDNTLPFRTTTRITVWELTEPEVVLTNHNTAAVGTLLGLPGYIPMAAEAIWTH
ncbi:hypothetical protein RhiJN_22393 [Ceratobasidium sp. AG-Ba]|nr:hypothetical protein RhiJN_22393 [Ceratobasidium sp. AG-Ba]